MNSVAITAVITLFLGCVLNNIFLEYIINLDSGAGHLITFSQFVFVAAHGFIFTSKFGTVEPKLARKNYMTLVIFFFITSVMTNWTFSFNISVPLHMIFRAGTLTANMLLGIWILHKKYSWDKYLSVAMITVGIIICTVHSSEKKTRSCSDCDEIEYSVEETVEQEDFFWWWVIGLTILTAALLLSARMGIYQEHLYQTYGKHPNEALYYVHLYSLPGFIFYAPNIWNHIQIANQSEPFQFSWINFALPTIWLYIILNVLTQYLCISSVYVLTTECTSLTVTLIVTLRKFISLIVSILYFHNKFTAAHWFGTALVFVGTLLFAEVFQNIFVRVSDKDTKED